MTNKAWHQHGVKVFLTVEIIIAFGERIEFKSLGALKRLGRNREANGLVIGGKIVLPLLNLALEGVELQKEIRHVFDRGRFDFFRLCD